TFVTTMGFLDHFGLESPSDLPGVQELKAAGLLDNRTPTPLDGAPDEEAEDEDGARREDTDDMFE
ncbi:MAG: SMC-Scp complex subunit ScpB, partial [Pseudomonadota bacterium]